MNKETIEKAARKYAFENAWYPGETSYESDIREMEQSFSDAFISGAQWRIDSVWHDMGAEVPQIYGEYGDLIYPQIPCLVVGHLSTGYGYGVRYWNVTEQCWDDEECDDYECDKDKIEEWAYLDDLIPERRRKQKNIYKED